MSTALVVRCVALVVVVCATVVAVGLVDRAAVRPVLKVPAVARLREGYQFLIGAAALGLYTLASLAVGTLAFVLVIAY